MEEKIFKNISKRKHTFLKDDSIVIRYNNQLDQLVRCYRIVEKISGTRAVKKWICKEAQAKYIFLKTELDEYIKLNYS